MCFYTCSSIYEILNRWKQFQPLHHSKFGRANIQLIHWEGKKEPLYSLAWATYKSTMPLSETTFLHASWAKPFTLSLEEELQPGWSVLQHGWLGLPVLLKVLLPVQVLVLLLHANPYVALPAAWKQPLLPLVLLPPALKKRQNEYPQKLN